MVLMALMDSSTSVERKKRSISWTWALTSQWCFALANLGFSQGREPASLNQPTGKCPAEVRPDVGSYQQDHWTPDLEGRVC
jgi:hypothetical protein